MEQVRNTPKILLVDDEPFVLRLLWRQLVDLGHSDIYSYEQATAALAKLESDPSAFDLVFCDLQMPEMDGVEFVRHLARIGFRGGLVLVSGEDARILQTVERLAQAQHLNILGALHKPTTPEKLRQILRLPDAAAAPPESSAESFSAEKLARAIAGDELLNHYQPKVEIATGEVVGVEALVRWRPPDAGLVLPDRFIPLAEQSDLIDALTQVVLADALAHNRLWRAAGIHLHVAVNVSMVSLSDLAFVDRVTDAVAAAQVPMSSLVLEVTESQLMKDLVAPLDILTRLRLRHIGLSIDDFGTGHSSLAKLRDFPFSELKIDRSFIHGAWREPSLRSLVEASLSMAHQFGMIAVAEGVEDQEDWDFLRQSGCDVAQGYFIGRPMPADKLAEWISDWAVRRNALVGPGS